MPLFLLTLKDQSRYDEAHGFVVRARDTTTARRVVVKAAENPENWNGPGGEGAAAWSDPNRSTCNRIPENGSHDEIILRDFNAG